MFSKNDAISADFIIVAIIRADPTKTEKLAVWNGFLAMGRMGGSILRVVKSIGGL